VRDISEAQDKRKRPLTGIENFLLSLIALIPACSLVNLGLTLLGHLIFLMGPGKITHIHTIPVLSSVATGAVGGAIWGGVCLAIIAVLYMLYGAEGYVQICRIGVMFAIASPICSPPIGAAAMSSTFHGNILPPLTAMGASLVEHWLFHSLQVVYSRSVLW